MRCVPASMQSLTQRTRQLWTSSAISESPYIIFRMSHTRWIDVVILHPFFVLLDAIFCRFIPLIRQINSFVNHSLLELAPATAQALRSPCSPSWASPSDTAFYNLIAYICCKFTLMTAAANISKPSRNTFNSNIAVIVWQPIFWPIPQNIMYIYTPLFRILLNRRNVLQQNCMSKRIKTCTLYIDSLTCVYRLLTIAAMLTSQSATDNYCSAITDGRFNKPHARDVLLFCLRNVRYFCLWLLRLVIALR